MSVRYLLYNKQLEEILEREENGTSIVIRPPENLNISFIEREPDEMERVYMIGRKEGERRLKEVIDFLNV